MIQEYTNLDGIDCVIVQNTDGSIWSGYKTAYDETANSLASKFVKNFEKFAAETSPEILAAAPKVMA